MKLLKQIPAVIHLRYPIILVHGIANTDKTPDDQKKAWGVIPQFIKEKGAQVFFGKSDSWGTIEHNAALLRQTVEQVLRITGSRKINIIAHSKGGLDARRMIAEPGMDDKIASLTTVSTPHKGVYLTDLLFRCAPKRLIRWISRRIDNAAAKNGDTEPDSYRSGLELSTEYCRRFNARIADSPKVLYNSVSAKANRFAPKWWIPMMISKFTSQGSNDGIVPESSAEWGECTAVANMNHDTIQGKNCHPKQKRTVILLYGSILAMLAANGL